MTFNEDDRKVSYVQQELEYQDIAFDEFVRTRQSSLSTAIPREQDQLELEPKHKSLIRNASHFYLSSVTGAGWPYVQHRGGPAGFVHVLGPTQLGWLEFHGNNQFVNTGNMDRDGRVCLFFVDYPTRKRLKVFGVGRVVEKGDDPALMDVLAQVGDTRIRSNFDRAMVIDVVAADANCSKYITPRHTKEQVDERIAPYRTDISQLRKQVEDLTRQVRELQQGC